MKLTVTRINALKCDPGQRDKLVFDDDQKGLAVRVTAAGSKSYLAQYTIGGQRKRVPLGNCDALSLADARAAVCAIMGKVASGVDTAAERKAAADAAKAEAERQRLTLGVLVDTWKALHLANKRARYAAEAVRALQNAFAAQWDQPAENLDRAAVVRVLDGMAKAGAVAMASRTAAYGRACYQWAMKRGTIAVNPFAALPSMGEAPKRDRVLADGELAEVWKAAGQISGPFGGMVQFLILTGQRREEVGGITWGEISADLSIWTLPGSRAKNGADHLIPLSEPARELLRSLPRSGALVFPGEVGLFQGWSKAKTRLDALLSAAGYPVEAWRIHDLRRTLATGLQRLGVRLEVTEAVLNHVSGSRSGIVGVYQRHSWADEKRAALDAWGEHVMALVEGRTTAGNVVQMRAG
ncbi:MAG TPA: integrase arm-type DNA-binding domain-containing protein [Patescibacteria group bacterium]|nr:integrase arm-type DNA-binding domain-containing protein [Patescibacteria group bacterium]